MLLLSIAPDSCTLAAIGANINIFPAHQNLLPKSLILVVMPYLFKAFTLQVAKGVLGIFIKATGHH